MRGDRCHCASHDGIQRALMKTFATTNPSTSENVLPDRLDAGSRRVSMEQSEVAESTTQSGSGAEDDDDDDKSLDLQELSQDNVDWEKISQSVAAWEASQRNNAASLTSEDEEWERAGLAAVEELERKSLAATEAKVPPSSHESVSPESKRRKVRQLTFTRHVATKLSSINEAPREDGADVSRRISNTCGVAAKKTSPDSKRLSKQISMEQYVQKNANLNAPKLEETDDLMFVGDRMYKAGETWTCIKMPGYFFTISRLLNKFGRGREAVCGLSGVTVALEKTFLGPVESKRVIAAWKKQGKLNADKAVVANTLKVLDKGKLPLNNLTHREMNWPGAPELYYERGMNDKEQSDGYTCAYRYNVLEVPRQPPPSIKPVVLDLFAGCGAMSLAFNQEGFQSLYKIEIDEMAIASLKINFPGAEVFEEGIERFIENCQTRDDYPKRGEIDHIHASPPCQGFSKANTGHGVNDKANNKLLTTFIPLVDYYRPPSCTMENVKGLLDRKSTKCKREHLLEVMAELILLNYQVRLCVCNASDYGDAQDRVRVILFGARKDYKLPDFPKATHGTMEDVRKGIVQQLRKTARDVLGDLEMIDPVGRGETVKQDAKRIRDHTTQGTDLGKHNTMQLLVAEEPVMTVCKKNPMKHYSKERKLTVREFARLQSFPDVFQFVGEHSDKRSQIGNAVPLNLGRAVARAVMDSHRHYRSRWDAQSNSERRTS